jgi:hypothetical protein
MPLDSPPNPVHAGSPSREEALRHVRQLRGFYIHCLLFVVGNTANVLVNVATRGEGGNWWFQWPLIAWSVVLAVHGLTVVGRGSWLGPNWEERKVREYMTPAVAPRDDIGRSSL